MYVQIYTHVYTHLVYYSYMCTQSTCTHTYVCSNTHTCVYTPPGVSHLHVHTIYLHAHICMYVCTASPAMPIPSHIPRTRPTCQNQPLFPRSNRLKRVGLHHTNLCAWNRMAHSPTHILRTRGAKTLNDIVQCNLHHTNLCAWNRMAHSLTHVLRTRGAKAFERKERELSK